MHSVSIFVTRIGDYLIYKIYYLIKSISLFKAYLVHQVDVAYNDG